VTLGEGEVLVQQTIAVKRARPVGEKRLRVLEADGPRRLGHRGLPPGPRPGRGASPHAYAVTEEELVEPHRKLLAPPDEERQLVEGEVGDREPRRRPQPEPQGGP